MPDGRSDDPHRRAALRPGGLDRGAGAGFHPVAEVGRLQRDAVAVSAYVSLLLEHRGRLAVQATCGCGRRSNYAIDRDGLCSLLNGIAKPAVGLYPPGNPFFGNPTQKYTYDPAKAKALLTEAGYGPDKPVKAKIMISTSGSGQMLPIPMNEFMQQNFTAVGMQIDFDVVEWGTMLVAIRSDPKAPPVHGVQGINISLSSVDPSTMFRYYAKDSFSPDQLQLGALGRTRRSRRC